MFEARLANGSILKKIIDAVKDLCQEVNFDCNESGISVQAMDSSHVSLVAFLLRDSAFEHYRCDRALSLGINMGSMAKIFKICGNDDTVTMKADQENDAITFTFETPDADRVSDFQLKLMDIDSEHLGIPDTEYSCIVKMPSVELRRICQDMNGFGDTISISCTKEGVKFTVKGEIGTGNTLIKPKHDVDKEEDAVHLDVVTPVALQFALRYFNFFTKYGIAFPELCALNSVSCMQLHTCSGLLLCPP
eukprot:Filipodium_phascolosomae@DN401_c0_g1_i2.p1